MPTTWVQHGDKERDHLQTLLAPCLIARIEHVGSTSIPGLLMKPIIDLQAPTTADLTDMSLVVAALIPHDWHNVDPDLDQRPWRPFFAKVAAGGGAPTSTS